MSDAVDKCGKDPGGLWTWVWELCHRDLYDWATLALAVFGAALTVAGLFYTAWRRRIVNQVRDPVYRRQVIRKYNCSEVNAYYIDIRRLLKCANKFYFKKFGTKSFLRCLTMALIYPIASVLVCWVFLDQVMQGDMQFLRTNMSFFERALGFGALCALLIWLVHFWQSIAKAGEGHLQATETHELSTRLSFKAVFAAFDYRKFSNNAASLFLLLPPVIAGYVGGSFGYVIAVLAVYVLTAALAAKNSSGVLSSLVLVLTLLSAASFMALGQIDVAQQAIFVFVLLPLLNALTDWLSVSFTRTYLEKLLRRKKSLTLQFYFLVTDIALGLLCLMALLGGIVGLLEVWALIHPGSVPLNWRTYWKTALDEPLQALPLWLMCFTTLLPTLVHVVYGLTIWYRQKSGATNIAVMKLKAMSLTPSDAEIDDVVRHFRRGWVWGAARGAGYWIPGLIALIFVLWNTLQAVWPA